MTSDRLTLTDLVVTNHDLPVAAVRFAPGLNLIVGASDTGKTFVFDAIDFMFGARALRRIPQSEGYTRVRLSIEPTVGPPMTLTRGFDGGEVEVSEFAGGRQNPPTTSKILGVVHGDDPNRSLSAYLLQAIGLSGRHVRKNSDGEKQALSLRNVCRLVLVREEEIIQQVSPILTGQYTLRTAELNTFAFFLSGQDDSAITAREKPAERKARLNVEQTVVEAILAEKRKELAASSPDAADLADQANRLEVAIERATESVAATQAEIGLLSEARRKLLDEQTERRSRLMFLSEQLKRLRLLDDYYQTDRERMLAVTEAIRVFHDLPEGKCPLCSQPLSRASEPSHGEFETACEKEVQKVDTLSRDLNVTIADFGAEEEALKAGLLVLERQLADTDEQLQKILLPAARSSQADLQQLIRTRTAVAQGATLQATVRGLEDRLAIIVRGKEEKTPKAAFVPRATTGTATEFCQVVEGILEAWKYPGLGAVTFDTEKADLVIGGQDRASKGKGYRALTYAAFTIGLMRYCRQKGIPHPGFVVLDTPLNPFKGPASTATDDKLTDAVKVAVFEDLANDQSGDQVIILENEEPPAEVRERVVFYRFTKNPAHGRYGFFPVAPAAHSDD